MSKKIETILTELANDIANGARGADVPLDEKVNAFKALKDYYAMTAKLKDKAPEDPDEKPTFGNFAKKIQAVS